MPFSHFFKISINTILFFVVNSLLLSFFAYAEEIQIYSNDHHNRIIINDNIGSVGNSYLFFGDSLAHSLTWDNANNSFIFSDDVNFLGNEIINVRLENLTSAPNCNTSFSGRVYHNTSDTFSYVCDGTTWNKIDEETATAGAGKLQPYFNTIVPNSIKTNVTTNIIITGGNFDEDTVFSVGTGVTLNSVTINSDKQATLNVSSNNTEHTNISVNAQNDTLNDFGQALSFSVKISTWVDLRSGGDVFTAGNAAGNDIRYRSGMSMNRDANGMSFSGSNPWSSWVKFESLGWTRGQNKTLQWIFTGPTSGMMIGIGSDATNEGASDQYRQSEINAYFSGATNFWGLYGNNGTIGSTGNQSNGQNITAGGVYKIKFTNDGTKTSGVFTLYQLPSSSQTDWDDESNILKTFTIGGSLNPNETNLMPFLIPISVTTQRFIAVKVE